MALYIGGTAVTGTQTLDATRLSGNLPAISGASLTGISAGGITEADQWRLTTSFDLDGTTNPLSSNLERADGTGQSNLGTGMSVSSGIWTFPSTGFWKVESTFVAYGRGNVGQVRINIYATTDDSSYSLVSTMAQAMHSNNQYGNGHCSTIVDVTDTANIKVKFVAYASANANFQGDSSTNFCHFTFTRLGDT
jgi:hypothetical protein